MRGLNLVIAKICEKQRFLPKTAVFRSETAVFSKTVVLGKTAVFEIQKPQFSEKPQISFENRISV